MAENELRACSYQILRYLPNLIRDEWVNIGVLLSNGGGRPRLRLISENAELARVRRLHPGADERLLRALGADLQAQLDAAGSDVAALLRKLEDTLSNAIQFSPRHGVLTEDMDAELDRIYHEQVEPPARRRGEAAAVPASRGELRVRINSAIRTLKMSEQIAKGLPVAAYTSPGDPFKLDYSYRRNGTRGFLHAVVLGGDPAAAKVLAYTADSIRAKLDSAEFHAITEVEPQAGNPRHEFLAGLLGKSGISTVPVARVGDFLEKLRPQLRQ